MQMQAGRDVRRPTRTGPHEASERSKFVVFPGFLALQLVTHVK